MSPIPTPLKIIQERMGHALTGSFTLDVYGHVLDWQSNVDAANKAGAMIEQAVDAVKSKDFVNVTAMESGGFCNWLKRLVAGGGFEPPTFGL
jgi:hypothetical protein